MNAQYFFQKIYGIKNSPASRGDDRAMGFSWKLLLEAFSILVLIRSF